MIAVSFSGQCHDDVGGEHAGDRQRSQSRSGEASTQILDLIRRTASARVALRLLRMMAWGETIVWMYPAIQAGLLRLSRSLYPP